MLEPVSESVDLIIAFFSSHFCLVPFLSFHLFVNILIWLTYNFYKIGSLFMMTVLNYLSDTSCTIMPLGLVSVGTFCSCAVISYFSVYLVTFIPWENTEPFPNDHELALYREGSSPK